MLYRENTVSKFMCTLIRNLVPFLAVDRIISAFNYHRHIIVGKLSGNHTDALPLADADRTLYTDLFVRCFTNVHDFVHALRNTTQPCHKQAVKLVWGKNANAELVHFRTSYPYYAAIAWTNRTKPVAVLRTEHQTMDVMRLEQLLGGTHPEIFQRMTKHTHGSESYGVPKTIGPSDVRALCCAVTPDFQCYHEIILAAVNLLDSEKEETIHATQRRCGIAEEDLFLDPSQWNTWHNKHCPKLKL